MTIENYHLFGLLPTRANMETISRYRFSYANADHCLVVAEEAPEGAQEIGQEDAKLLQADDWAWLYAVSGAIRAEREDKYAKELQSSIDDFMARFEAILEDKVGGKPDGGTENDRRGEG